MRTKLLAGLAWVVATGYLLSICFRGMNASSDLTYIAGILALSIWFVVVTPLIVRKLFKEKKQNVNEVGVNVGDGPAGPVDDRLHNSDRPGNGRN